MYRSLGKYIEHLEREGELLRIGAEVSPRYEIAEITERMAKSAGGGKALLFENTGTPFPVATNLMGSERRIAMALGADSLDDISSRIASITELVTSPKDSFAEKLRMLPLLGEMSRWLPRTSGSRGECQQVVHTGSDMSLDMLPILCCRPYDGGRFITLPMVHTVDPDTGIRNVGMYRMQVFDGRTTGMHWHRHKTGARHYDAYRAAGRRIMPVSVAIGGDPAYAYCATAPMPDNMDEYLLAGFLRRRNVVLVKSLTNDIYVPADCDFVIEGYVDTAERPVTEGDFGDHTGFYSLKDEYPAFHVTAITHRRDAIYPATVVGIPPQEDTYISRATERIFLAPIRLAMQPEIEDLSMPSAGCSHNLAIISIRRRYTGQASKVMQAMWGAGQMMFNKYAVVVPAGCDVRSPERLSALLRGCDIRKSAIRSEGIYDILDHATATCGYGGKLALDLTDTAGIGPLPETAMPDTLPAGISACRTDMYSEWSLILLFARPDATADAAALLDSTGIRCNFAVILDTSAAGLPPEDLLWLATANTDPRRDVSMHGSTMIVDARPKVPGRENNPGRWPNVVVSSEDTVALVDRRWSEYGIGEPIPSPSSRYRILSLSDGAEW